MRFSRFCVSLASISVTSVAWISLSCSDTRELSSLQSAAMSPARVWTRLHTDVPSKLRVKLERDGVDVTGSSQRLGYVDFLASASKRDELLARYLKLIRAAEALDMRGPAQALPDYRDPDEISQVLDQVEADFPAIARKVTLASGLPEGHILYALKISDNVGVDEDEPTFLLDAQAHAREVMTSEIALDAIHWLTSRYETDPQVTRWVDELEIWIVPVLNPDGAAHMFSFDPWWRKNRVLHQACHGEVGVDLNRNFTWTWNQCGGSSGECSAEIYRGPAAGSEVETQALEKLVEELRPLYNLNYHSYGEYIIWPTGCGENEEEDLFAEIGSALNNILPNDTGQTGGYSLGTAPEVLYEVDGDSVDHAYAAAGAMAFTIEVNADGFVPDFATFRDVTCERQRIAWSFFLDRTLDGPAVRGHVLDASSLQPVTAQYTFINHPLASGQAPLRTDASGRFGRATLPDSEHTLVFITPGYIPAARSLHVAGGPVDLDVLLVPGQNHAPNAQAGLDQTVNEGDTVHFDAGGSTDSDGNMLFFTWIQRSGPKVSLGNPNSSTQVFHAPGATSDQALVFDVLVSDGELESTDSLTLTVRDLWPAETVEASPGAAIIDHKTTTSTIHVDTDGRILWASVRVDITHSFIGDLSISLGSPGGKLIALQNQAGGGTADLHRDFELSELIGQQSGGDWTLGVTDHASGDQGVLDHWALTLELLGDLPCLGPADCDLPHVDLHTCDGRCGVASCDPGFADCDAVSTNGCEIDRLRDPANCGGCGFACEYSHADGLCQDGACVMGTCLAPWADCDGASDDGCEIDTETDIAHCGGCGAACTLEHAVPTCLSGVCWVEACLGTFFDCDHLSANGCEVDAHTSLAQCGGCGQACALDHASESCVAGVCTLGACEEGWANCDGEAQNGCEVDTRTNLAHCGGCGRACALDHASESCAAGVCVLDACEAGFASCDGGLSNGCEVDTRTSLAHCGGCGQACALDHASEVCEAGVCRLGACDGGFLDCDGEAQNGCEIDSQADPKNCGTCGLVCRFDNGSAGCKAGACAMGECQSGYGDCNLSPSDGCEVDVLTDPAHCGQCGYACLLPHATSGCALGVCTLAVCDTPFRDCDAEVQNGCEVDTSADLQHCGGCGRACALAHASQACQAGVCVLLDCEPGYGDCNQDTPDGCETSLQSVTNCGSCGLACAPGLACLLGESGFRCVDVCPDADADGHEDAQCGGDDCDDSDAAIHPGAAEICGDGIDQDCDSEDAVCPCPDADLDGHEDAQCGGDDCDDGDAAIRPGAAEVCGDGIDQDCDSEDAVCPCPDTDLDGHEDAQCGGDDCDDSDAAIHPGAAEICGDGIDQDCDSEDAVCPGQEGGGCGCSSGGGGGLGWIAMLVVALVALCRSRR